MLNRVPKISSFGPFTGLRARVVLFLAGLTVAMLLLFGVAVTGLLEHHLLEQKRAQGRIALLAIQSQLDLTEVLGDTMRSHVPQNSGPRPTLGPIVRTLVANLELTSLMIVDRQQNIVGASREDVAGLVLAEPDLARAMNERKLIHRLVGEESGSPEVIFSGPLFQAGAVVGAARFGLPQNDMVVALAKTRHFLYLYAFMDALAITLFGSLVLWQVLVKPIDTMVAATERMAAGDYRVALKTRGAGEIRRLNRALASLAATLQDRDAIGRRQVERLERINKELRSAHDQLLHTDRLAYVGRVAAGVAHEVGNPLGAIYGYLEILRDGGNLGDATPQRVPPNSEIIDRLEKEIKRIDATMRELLNFSRVRESRAEPLDLLARAGETVTIMKRQRGLDNLEINVESVDGLPRALIDPQHYQQILLNILLNAADAMNGRGVIDIRAGTGPYNRADLMEACLPGAPDEQQVPFTDLRRRGIIFSEMGEPYTGAPTVRLTISDSGPGMPPDVLARVFDPFFTTKPPGRGTGLGMAVCQQLTATAGGMIRIESREGVGTCVTLIFPAQEHDD
jgi:signal transduction histidine kinase